MEVRLFSDDVRKLLPIIESWKEEAVTNDLGIAVEDTGKYLAELHDMAFGNNSNLLVLYDGDDPVGYLGLRYFISPLSQQKMANEHYYYVIPDKRGMASIRLLKDAKILAKIKGCSHIILNASNLASSLHDKVCEFYKRLGMKKFETSYIQEIK